MTAKLRIPIAMACVAINCVLGASPVLAYDTIGNGYGSKWGADPNAGTGAIVTWGYMLDGTTLDPTGFPDHSFINGTSNISALRDSVDTHYGTGAFDTAIQNAFNTWSAVANVTFVGPVTDSGLPVGADDATAPHIRIGAFHWTEYGSALGYGPPGPWGPDYFPLSGDVLFNVNGIGTQRPYQIAPGIEDATPVDVYNYGDDVEGLFLHELGHAAIGLDHPRWAGDNPDQRVMYVGDWTREDAPYCCQSLNRQLSADDIAAAQYVYGIRGDFNRDAEVSAADYVLWRKLNGTSTTPGTSADANVDGLIDTADYTSWHTHFGNKALAGYGEQPSMWPGTTVPEPSTFLTACLYFLLFSTTLRSRLSS